MDKRRKKKIGKANERKGKVKRAKGEEVNGQGGKRGAPAPHGGVGSGRQQSWSIPVIEKCTICAGRCLPETTVTPPLSFNIACSCSV